MEPAEIAEKYHMSISAVTRRIYKLGMYPTKNISNQQFKKMIDTSIDVSSGLSLLYKMAMETAMEKREEAEEWAENRTEFQEFVGMALADEQVSLGDPRVNWLEKFATQKDPNEIYIKASAEARACMEAYVNHRKILMNDQSVERIKEALAEIYALVGPDVRMIIEKLVFTETIEGSVVPYKELGNGSD